MYIPTKFNKLNFNQSANILYIIGIKNISLQIITPTVYIGMANTISGNKVSYITVKYISDLIYNNEQFQYNTISTQNYYYSNELPSIEIFPNTYFRLQWFNSKIISLIDETTNTIYSIALNNIHPSIIEIEQTNFSSVHYFQCQLGHTYYFDSDQTEFQEPIAPQ